MTGAPMLRQKVHDPRAWRADTVDAPAAWYRPVPDELLEGIKPYLRELSDADHVTDVMLTETDQQRLAEYVAGAQYDLELGRGFVILDKLPMHQLSPRQATCAYWLIGQLLGEPFAQNVQGTLLYDVRDTGQDLSAGARFSVTNYESSFHTDNSFGDTILDYVGLLCLKTAQAGGISQNVSGYAVHNVLFDEHPEVLETLYQPFHVDRRGGFKEGESATVRRPIITWDGSELELRYLRYWIEAGHEKAGQPLTATQRRALDVFDSVLARPDLRVEFSLAPGQMYFINNRWILHNRTAFTDSPELERRRHLVRLWLRAWDERWAA